MKRNYFLRLLLFTVTLFLPIDADAAEEPAATRCYELRIYHANEGKLEALNSRFKDHTTQLFTKHGMTNLAYWMPIENPDRLLIYLLSYPSLAARQASWKAFQQDPEWKSAAKASEVDGKLVAKVESRFLTLTGFSPEPNVDPEEPAHLYEMRTYTATSGNLPRLLERFKQHTISLFSQHGIHHYAYFTPSPGEPGADDTLIYFVVHESPEAQAASFKAFRADPKWLEAKAASEVAGGGSLTIPEGIKSVTLKATDYSPIQ